MQNKPGQAYILTDTDFYDAVYDCVHSRYVRNNPTLVKTSDQVLPMPVSDEVINAMSFAIPESLRDTVATVLGVDRDKYSYGIEMTAGILRWMSALGFVSTYFTSTRNISKTRSMLEYMAESTTDCHASSDFVPRFLKKYGGKYDFTKDEMMKTYAISSLRAVTAHELGHICLSHVSNVQEDSKSMSRIDEREADLFAASVMQSMNTGIDGVIGECMAMISFAWMLSNLPKAKVDFMDHPACIERVRNFLEAGNSVLAGSNITSKMILKLCKE